MAKECLLLSDVLPCMCCCLTKVAEFSRVENTVLPQTGKQRKRMDTGQTNFDDTTLTTLACAFDHTKWRSMWDMGSF